MHIFKGTQNTVFDNENNGANKNANHNEQITPIHKR